jgi:hypothetical protein
LTFLVGLVCLGTIRIFMTKIHFDYIWIKRIFSFYEYKLLWAERDLNPHEIALTGS